MNKIDEKKDNMEQITDRDYAELLMLYQITINDIEKAKQRGWTVTYTTIAAQGAILGLFSAYNAGAYLGWIKFIFVLLSIGMTILGIQYIKHAQESLEGFRALLKDVIGRLGGQFTTLFGEPTQKKKWPLEPVLWAVTFIVCYLIIINGSV
jgi:hypothetical protein